jgi:hypothetical protein
MCKIALYRAQAEFDAPAVVKHLLAHCTRSLELRCIRSEARKLMGVAETIALARMYGLNKQRLIEGIKFPFKGNKYEMSIVEIGREAKGIIIGTISAGGSVFVVTQRACSEDYEHVHKQTH